MPGSGRQSRRADEQWRFSGRIADSRTFGFLHEVEALQAAVCARRL